MFLADLDIVGLYTYLKSMGLSGWLLITIVGVVIFVQYKSGNLGNIWAQLLKLVGWNSNALSLDDKVHIAVADHLDAIGITAMPTKEESAYHAALELISYFENDQEGKTAAVKCGERLFHVQAPPING